MAPRNSTLMKSISTTETLSSEEEEIDEEIPIRINKTTRFISGLSLRTSVNDVILALIDDELANTTTELMQMKTEPQNYVLTERYLDIERFLDEDERILELWLSWGENRCDVEFRLKINKQGIQTKRSLEEKKIKKTGIKKLLKRIIDQGDLIQKHLLKIAVPNERAFNKADPHERTIASCNEASRTSVDELFLIIETQENDQDSGVFVTKTQNEYSQAATSNNAENNFTECDYKFETVHNDVKVKFENMKEIIQQEHSFLTKINKYTFDCLDLTLNGSDCNQNGIENTTITI